MKARCIGTNRLGTRCGRVPAVGHAYCHRHENEAAPETQAERDQEFRHFLVDVIDSARRGNADLVFEIACLAFTDATMLPRIFDFLEGFISRREAERAALPAPTAEPGPPAPEPAVEQPIDPIEDDDTIEIVDQLEEEAS